MRAGRVRVDAKHPSGLRRAHSRKDARARIGVGRANHGTPDHFLVDLKEREVVVYDASEVHGQYRRTRLLDCVPIQTA